MTIDRINPFFIILIAPQNYTKFMRILMVLVIATFIIVGAYVGYHAAQEAGEKEMSAHSIGIEIQAIQDLPIKIIHQDPKPVTVWH